MGLTIPNISNLPGVSRPGGDGFINKFCLDFTPAAAKVVMANLFFPTQSIISMWFNNDSASPDDILLGSNSSSEQIRLRTSSGNIQILASSHGNSKTFNTTVAYSANTWYHIAFYFTSGTALTIYVNGQLFTTSTSWLTAVDFKSIGNSVTSGAQGFDGTIDEVSFFNNNTIDINDLYNNGKPGELSSFSPSTWYRFEEGSGSVANNSGSANNNGTITAAVYSTSVP